MFDSKKINIQQEIIQKMQNFWIGKPIRKAYLFGSVVSDDFLPTSDVDILVELDSTKTIGMIEYIKIMEDLENIIGRKVDLITSDGISEYIKPFIDKEKRLIYEA